MRKQKLTMTEYSKIKKIQEILEDLELRILNIEGRQNKSEQKTRSKLDYLLSEIQKLREKSN